mmetsp:Transcript_22342/g.36751  ORF Transcript_22342/g.36751 Transcript_22342/m.36751 type:complete len:430 (-) Transcript_22342:11-1300(-)
MPLLHKHKMNETTIMLTPSPGVKPEFLATVEPVSKTSASQQFSLPFEVVLDGYTREPWSSGGVTHNSDNNSSWKTGYLLSTDGRNRLPGFLKYLRDRKKACIAKLNDSTASTRAILVVPFDPPPVPSEQLPAGVDKTQLLYVKYLADDRLLSRGKKPAAADPNEQLQMEKQKQKEKQMQQQQKIQREQQQRQKQRTQQKNSTQAISTKQGFGGGILGNLLGAQLKTQNHLDVVRTKRRNNDLVPDLTSGAAGAITSFREKVAADLEKFKSDNGTFVTKVSISLAALVSHVPMEERDKVTMDVFKYVVYEQVEEVGMDKWVAAKEPTDFIDEIVIAVYKEGHAPADVLEDLNKADLPAELKGLSRHMADTQSKIAQRKDKRSSEVIMKQNIVGEDNVVVLNTNKRDRRTLEQIQKDMMEDISEVKKSRFD